MSDAFLWHMIDFDGLARSIILWGKTVIIVDGTRPDFNINMSAWETPSVAYVVANLETQSAEQRGLEVRNVYGLRGTNGGFASNVATAHRFYLMRELESLELVVADLVFIIQRDGEKLDD